MDRKRRLPCEVLTCVIPLFFSCIALERTGDVEIVMDLPSMHTRAALPDEERISDVCLMIFDNSGNLEYRSYETEHTGRTNIRLLKGERYSIYAFVNFGYEIQAENEIMLKELEYHLAYPDEYRNGIPMTACTAVVVGEVNRIRLEPERLMSRISIRIDRSALDDDVRMDIVSARIGNCPKKVRVFEKSRALSEDDCFVTGFSHNGADCMALNTEDSGRISEAISLYMLENMQGQFSTTGIGIDEEKVFAEYDSRSRICSFIEMEMDYRSPLWTSTSIPLKYRFYLGEDRNNLDIERNCHYHITVCPEGDGLKGDGWRVDKTGLKYTGETGLEKYPSGYIRGDIGDKIHLGCILTPVNTPFDVGIEYMEDDKEEGIYDYNIDEDGHGVTLTLTGPGSGLIYMEAGAPINEAALFIIEVNLPDNQKITPQVSQDRVQ